MKIRLSNGCVQLDLDAGRDLDLATSGGFGPGGGRLTRRLKYGLSLDPFRASAAKELLLFAIFPTKC